MATQTLSRKTTAALTHAGFSVAGTAAHKTTEHGTAVRIARVERGWVVAFGNARTEERNVDSAIGRALAFIASERARHAEKNPTTAEERAAVAQRNTEKTAQMLRNAPKADTVCGRCAYLLGSVGHRVTCN